MKLTVLLIILSLFHAQAETFSQTISFSGKNVSIGKVFKAIEQQTGYLVFANKGLLKEVKPVSLSVRNMPLETFLDLLLKGQPIDYEINIKTIFIKEKPVILHPLPAGQFAEEIPPLPPVTGRVVNSAGAPLEGATVSVKGTEITTTTGADGRFSVNAGSGQVLVISYVGYDPLEEPVKGRTNINIVLKETDSQMDLVVVTALGIKRQTKALTYNVQEVNGEEVNRVKDPNFVNNLAGRVAGATINPSASGIGGSTRVVMRGAKSLAGNNNALYVVDGMPLPNLSSIQPDDVFQGAGQTGDGISNINPEDIASISVLTGPAAAALYGGQAANGVILITTRKGSPGRPQLTLSNSTSFFNPFVLPRFQNTYGSEPGSYFSWGPKLETPSSYSPKDFFQTGFNVTNGLSLSTGTDKNQTYFSLASVDGQGIIPGNKLDRYNISVRNTATFLDDKLSLDINYMHVWVKEKNMLAQGQYFNPLIPVYLFPVSDDIERYEVFERYNIARNFNTQFWPYGDLGFQMQNPYWIVNRDLFLNDKKRTVFSTALKYKLNEWINVTGRVKLDDNTTVAEKKYSASTSGLFASTAGAYHKNTELTQQIYSDLLVNLTTGLADGVDLNVNAGASILDIKYSQEGYGGNLLSVPNLFSFTNINSAQAALIQNRYSDQTQSVFASAQLSYRNRLFLDLTGRNDWSSALVNTTTKSIFYPSVGVSGIVTDLFRVPLPGLSFAKVRASYSEVGNPPERFISILTYPIIGGFPVTSSYLPATGLRAERTKSYEVGLNLRFLKNKISLDVTAYKSNTFDQLFNPKLAPSTGYSSFYVNAGEVQNKGIEASLGYNMEARDFSWSSSVTFSLNRNKILKLLANYADPVTGHSITEDSLSMGGTGSYMMALVRGGSIGDVYVNTLAVDEHGYINVGLVSQTVTAEQSTYIKAGNANPRYNIGFRNSFSYRNFNLDFLVNGRVGGVCVSVTQAIMDRFGVSEASAIARDQGGVIINGEKIPAEPYYTIVGGGVAGVGSMYTYSATNVRLAEASLGYTFKNGLFNKRIKEVMVSATGRNLFMFYNKAPFDPEISANTGTYFQGVDYFMQPSLRSVGFSVRLQF